MRRFRIGENTRAKLDLWFAKGYTVWVSVNQGMLFTVGYHWQRYPHR